MKFGIRTPNIKKSIKARTTGKAKRQLKSAVNPLYGKKGMGFVNNPKKAIYNKIYNRTTISVADVSRIISPTATNTPRTRTQTETPAALSESQQTYVNELASGISLFVFSTIFLVAFSLLSILLPFLAFLLLIPIVMYILAMKHVLKANKLKKSQ